MNQRILWILGSIILAAFTACSSGESSSEEASTEAAPAAEEPTTNDWQDLTTLDAWRNYKADTLSDKWKVEDGVIMLTGSGGGTIVTKEEYDNFELELDWKISEGGNSGLFFNVIESDELGPAWHSGPEYQLLDNERHRDAQIRKHRTGDNYDVQQSTVETVKPAGEWNTTRLVVNGNQVEHYLNGEKVVEYELGSQAWQDSVAASKFAELPMYGKADKGHIGLQDHGDQVWFRNIRIREL
jgi:cytochrome c